MANSFVNNFEIPSWFVYFNYINIIGVIVVDGNYYYFSLFRLQNAGSFEVSIHKGLTKSRPHSLEDRTAHCTLFVAAVAF